MGIVTEAEFKAQLQATLELPVTAEKMSIAIGHVWVALRDDGSLDSVDIDPTDPNKIIVGLGSPTRTFNIDVSV